MSIAYENERFRVVTDYKIPYAVGKEVHSRYGYSVLNKETGVSEYEDFQIHNAITYAEHANMFLKHKMWRIVAIQNNGTIEFLDKEAAGDTLDAALQPAQ